MLTFFALLLLPLAAVAAEPVEVHWLESAAPAAPAGIVWGVPWSKGQLQKSDSLRLTTADGTAVPMQSWTLASWPDGSVKWSGHAIAAAGSAPSAPLQLSAGPAANPEKPLRITESGEAIDIDNGMFVARIARHGSDIITRIAIGNKVIAEHGQLVAVREDRKETASGRVVGEEDFLGEIESVDVERSGPVVAIVKISGRHRAKSGARNWLPFTVRLSFFAGSGAVRLTHSFVFDGDPRQDFIRGLGIRFAVPFREQLHNRHIRFSGELDGGVWRQPVRMLPGYRIQAGQQPTDLYAAHLNGERTPNLDALEPRTRDVLDTMPIWGDAKLTQLSPNGWSLYKRTTADASWLHVTDGKRTPGVAVIGDVSGALALGVKDFWEKAPRSCEITGGGTDRAQITLWLWSPDAPAMDLRRYDEIPHGLAVNYEDWKPGWGTALGIANTNDVSLWVLDHIPSGDALVAWSKIVAAPPQLVCTPEYYHRQHVFGYWSLPDRSNVATRWVEDQVQGLLDFYQGQVEARSWYGFWDFGDIMHNYDAARHEWRYDVGGWAWVNTELMPDMLLWYSFLRTGRADLYRFAEAMTRHTSEVDVHHLGPFAPLGSRHNVNHWGDGAKQPRISHAGLKRFYYFLSGGDGRIGDLLREQIDADLAFSYLQQFNNSHYAPNPDGTPRLDERRNPAAPRSSPAVPAPRPEDFAPRLTSADRKPLTRFGLEWMCYALNWTTEWERGGDQRWRAQVESEMRAMAANVDAQGRFGGRYFDMIFGGPENMWEMEPMYDIPEFWRAWVNTCEAVGRSVTGGQMTGPRMLAYAAFKKQDAELGRLAWEKLIGPAGTLPAQPLSAPFGGANVVRPGTDPAFLGDPVGWQLHGVGSIQWALNAIETLELARPYLPDYTETAPAK